MLIALEPCHLQVENLYYIIMVVKNWPNDPWLNCMPIVTLEDYMKTKCVLVEENYDLIEEANFFEELKIDDN